MRLKHLISTVPLYGVLCMPSAPTSAHAFELTGLYEGTTSCDSTTDGDAWSWGSAVRVAIQQDGQDLEIDYQYIDTSEYGKEYALYLGKMAISGDGAIVSGFFAACGGTFPAQELVRMFPTPTKDAPFSFAADSIWVSQAVPNRPGLTVQSCRWALRRVSLDKGPIRACPVDQ